jgi:hypothetical protein
MSRGKRKRPSAAAKPLEDNGLQTQDMPELTDDEVLDVAEQLQPPVCPFPGAPDAGDKDPLVMSWYREHSTHEEYCRRYENRIVPQGEFMTPQTSGLFERPPTDFDDEEEPVKKPHVILS